MNVLGKNHFDIWEKVSRKVTVGMKRRVSKIDILETKPIAVRMMDCQNSNHIFLKFLGLQGNHLCFLTKFHRIQVHHLLSL